MRDLGIAVSLGLLAGCSPPVMFRVSVDEPVNGGKLTLNGHSASLTNNIDGALWGKWNGADAHGKIEIAFPDGGIANCEIGYVTQGMGIQEFSVSDRNCRQVTN